MASPALGPVSVATEQGGIPERGGVPDVAGAVALGCCTGWALIAAVGRDARPEGVLLAVLAVAAGYACGRIGGSLLPTAAPAGAAVAGLALALASPHTPLVPSVTVPDGRMGADAAVLTLAAGAACCAAWAARSPAVRRLLHGLALAVAAGALVIGSVAGFAAALVVLLCSLAAGRVRRRLPVLAGLLVVAVTVVGTVWAVAADALPPGLESSLEGRLGAHRVALWEDALALAVEQPVRGAGPDRFGELSPVARQAAGSDGKPHSAPLQMAAEQGLPGVVLLGAVFGWLLLALYRSPRPTPVVLTAGAALTVLAALVSVGNALSFNQVTMGAGLLAGLATARRMPQEPDGF